MQAILLRSNPREAGPAIRECDRLVTLVVTGAENLLEYAWVGNNKE